MERIFVVTPNMHTDKLDFSEVDNFLANHEDFIVADILIKQDLTNAIVVISDEEGTQERDTIFQVIRERG